MNRKNSKLIVTGWILVVLIIMAATFSATFYVTEFIYQKINLTPPALLAQLINSLLGLIFASLIMSILSQFIRDRQISPFIPIIQALERIAKGDFSIRLENDYHDNEIIGELVSGVNKMALELDQMENMRQEFISNVSHEIQSPLTSIRGFAQALRNEATHPEDRLHYLDIIEMESMRLSRMSDDLLKLASLESDQAKFEPRDYRLDKQVRSLILTCEPQWTEKEITMDVDLKEVSIHGDEDLLSQVWLNLIHNSIKFAPRNGVIKVSLKTMDNRVKFDITDNGIGIPVEDQERIFERFFKGDKSRTRSNGGSGLGLSIAKKIIEMHQGEIQVKSQPGAGSTFTVSLPA